MTVRIRPMRTADLDVLLPYEESMFGTESWSRQSYLDELADTTTRYYVVAEEDGTVLGSGGLLSIAETSQVMTVGVLPPARRRGLGALLMQALLTEARRLRSAEVLLEVRIDNLAARTMYDKLGFAVIGTRRGYFDHGRVDALVMRLGLGTER